jgi:hypothetical protein
LQRGNVTALTLGASGAVAFAGNLTSSAAQTWTLAAGTSALNIQSGLLNLDTTNSRVGIGTASPAQKLNVYAASGNDGIRIETGTNTASDYAVLRFTQGGGEKAVLYTNLTQTILKATTGTLDLWGSGSSGARIDSSGNFAVGRAPTAGTIFETQGDTVSFRDAASNVRLRFEAANSLLNIGLGTGWGLKLPATPGNADAQALDCYAETDVSAGYTLSGVTTTSGAITVAIRATRIGRTMTFAVSIAPAGGASLTFAAAWYLTMTGVSAPAFAGSLAVSSNDATITRGTAWVSATAAPTVYGSAAALGVNVILFLNGTI